MKLQDWVLRLTAYALMLTLAMLVIACFTGCNRRGDTGEIGIAGPPGRPAPIIPVYTLPVSSLLCPTGGSLLIVGVQLTPICNGSQGSTGATGVPGVDGQNGINGTDGTKIQIVQFCPGATSYPSQFSEVGFCIDHKLYAVYSKNDGFLSYIPNGRYNSNGINSSCSFTVDDNCSIIY